MKKTTNFKFVQLLFFLFATVTMFAQNGKSAWTKISEAKINQLDVLERKSQPNKAEYYQLNIEQLKTQLLEAPKREEGRVSNSIIELPKSNGEFAAYRVMEASVMVPSFQAMFPELRSYVGQNINEPSETVRFSVTPQGLHTMAFTNDGLEFIDPYTRNSNQYIVYNKSQLPVLEDNFVCHVQDEGLDIDVTEATSSRRDANDGKMRSYDIAIACTIEYSEFHWMAAGLTAGDTVADKKAAVLAAMQVTMTRVNGIYERDLSVTMPMVNNLSVIYIDSDNFSNDDATSLIGESQTVIDANIGFANYDVGHTFSTGGGGLATLNSPCTNSKARGITGSSAPVGDPYDIDYVAHELGHQFGGPHTFNGNTGSCVNNRSGSDAYEVGSGSTIMAYAGICAGQNVQSNSDAYFHQASLNSMWANISSGNSSTCDTETTTGNSVPTANAGSDYTIPKSTPYMLTGSSTDADGTATHTFTWEQYDLTFIAGMPAETNTSGPLVRSRTGTTNPTRFVPRMEDWIINQTSPTYEVLSSVARTINYKLTVRDNDSRGGQTASDDMVINVDASSGPFLVTSQPTEVSWTQGTNEIITWDVAGTNTGSVNEANVDILLSTDGGLTYPTVLANDVPNNGSYTITVPNIEELNCRVMVKGSNNIFYNINQGRIIIGYTVTTNCNTYSSGALGTAIPDGEGANMQGTPIFNTIAVSGETGTVVNTDMTVNVDVSHTYLSDILLQLSGSDGSTFANLWARECAGENNLDVNFKDVASAIVCAEPTVGDYQPSQPIATFNGVPKNGNWTLAVVDFYNGDTGTLNDWSIEFCTETATPILSVDEYEFEQFSVYPNPANDEVNLILSSQEDVKVSLYDIRGRVLFNKNYDNSNTIFETKINVGGIASGIYLLNVVTDNKTATKKLVIE